MPVLIPGDTQTCRLLFPHRSQLNHFNPSENLYLNKALFFLVILLLYTRFTNHNNHHVTFTEHFVRKTFGVISEIRDVFLTCTFPVLMSLCLLLPCILVFTDRSAGAHSNLRFNPWSIWYALWQLLRIYIKVRITFQQILTCTCMISCIMLVPHNWIIAYMIRCRCVPDKVGTERLGLSKCRAVS